jgi:Tol biopolymer transport system component
MMKTKQMVSGIEKKIRILFTGMILCCLILVLPVVAAVNEGKIVFASDRDGGYAEIYIMNANGTGQTRLTTNDARDLFPAWSPDGSKIAFASDRDGNYEIYVMNADGTGQTRITTNGASDEDPAWSPDGSKIAFSSDRDGYAEIYIMNTDGTGQTRLTTNVDVWEGVPAWSPDGTKITFTSERDGNFEIYVMNANGSGQTRLTTNASWDSFPVWSPDGTKIAFSSDRDDGNYEIYVMKKDGTGQTRLTTNISKDGPPAWSADGTKIAFSSDREGNTEIYVMNANGSGQSRITTNEVEDYDPDWGPLLAVRVPNGGQNWRQGSGQTIRWNYTGSPGPQVKIELLRGTAMNLVINASTSIGSAGSGSSSWTVPYNQPVGTDYKIRITSTTNAAYTDTSNANFTINAGAPITVAVPNGGQNWKQGSTQTIRWSYTGSSGPQVKIELLKGTAVNRVINASMSIGSAGSGSYSWIVPYNQVVGTDYKIRITSTTNAVYTDTSDANFTISAGAPVTVVIPNGGQNWKQGSTQTIRWSYTGSPGSNVKIELLRGTAVNRVINASTSIGSAGSGSSSWIVPYNQIPGKDYKIRITSTTNAVYTDKSDANFTISAGPPITVVVPDGGQNWKQGSTQTIRWGYTGSPGSKVKITLLKGTAVNSVINASTSIGSAGSGSYIWTVPYNQVVGTDYKIRITSTTNAVYTDKSDANFTISAGPPITVVVPDGGQNWKQGSTQTIRWGYTGSPGSKVKITLLKGTAVNQVINASTSIGSAGSGSYSWKIPYYQILGTDYKIRITSTSNAAYTDKSNANFTISAAANTGRIAFYSDRDGNYEIYIMNPDGSGQKRLTNNPAADFNPALSPDGSKIAFVSDRDIYFEIFVMNANGTGLIHLTDNAVYDVSPAWSPDGTKIAFVSFRDGNEEIYIMNANGSGQTRLTNNPAADYDPAWSPDGTKIAFSSGRNGNSQIYVMKANGVGQTRLTNNGAWDYTPAWSPEGTKIAFSSSRDYYGDIYVMNADGTAQTRVTNNVVYDYDPVWSPDGTKIAFISNRDGNYEIYAMNANGTTQTRLTNNAAEEHTPSWSPAPS